MNPCFAKKRPIAADEPSPNKTPRLVYLIPSYLHENTPDTVSPEVKAAITGCHVFYVEDERSARRYLKNLWKEMTIDDYAKLLEGL